MEAKGMTLEEFKELKPCWLEEPDKSALLDRIGSSKERWTALDVLGLPDEEVGSADKLWAVLRPEFIDEPILHEFACRCAEEALKLVNDPDPRSIAAIEAKRKWIRGEISDGELSAARSAARVAARSAARVAAWDAALSAVSAAAWDVARSAAWDAALSAVSDAAWSAASDAASDAARSAASAAASAAARYAARYAARRDIRKIQVEMLKELIKKECE